MPERHSQTPALFPWWQPVSIPVGTTWRCVVGPLTVWLQRTEDTWLLSSERLAGGDDSCRLESECTEAILGGLDLSRYVFRQTPAAACLRPRLLDRPVVVRTSLAMHVPPGEDITFYISSPVCLSVELRSPDCVLQEIAVQRLSDTWFGPSTRIGELCYASRTNARHSLAEVPLRPHRAVTPLTVKNRSQEMLPIGTISLPVPFLSVYGCDNGTLWTQGVVLEHRAAGELATLKVDTGAPADVPVARYLCGPRETPEKHTLVRAFTGILARCGLSEPN